MNTKGERGCTLVAAFAVPVPTKLTLGSVPMHGALKGNGELDGARQLLLARNRRVARAFFRR